MCGSRDLASLGIIESLNFRLSSFQMREAETMQFPYKSPRRYSPALTLVCLALFVFCKAACFATTWTPQAKGPYGRSPRGLVASALAQDACSSVDSPVENLHEASADIQSPPTHYYREMRATPAGNAFWAQKSDVKWGEFETGDPGAFDKDDLVEAIYPGSDEWCSGQIMKYVGNSNWIVMWLDDVPEDGAQASVVKTKDIKHIILR